MPATERIAIRIDSAAKTRVGEISKKHKMSSSEFIKKAIDFYIRYIDLEESETITLTRDDFSRLRALLLADAEPNERLRNAAHAYRQIEQRQIDARVK
ncbi:MAG: DUF1778 domain-containing protein [Ignavibacteria bacterium]|nr:DUF1778 domain-containing protein [Ignavibacteria bacterium]